MGPNQENPPDRDAFVFIKRDSWVAEANYKVRCFSTSEIPGYPAMLLPDDPATGAISPFALSKMGDMVEREGELIRRELLDSVTVAACSRLSGVFFFADLETCKSVSRLHGWDLATVRRGVAKGPVYRHDMQVVSILISRSRSLDESTRRGLWEHYWQGSAGSEFPDWDTFFPPEYEYRGPIWEHLVAGSVLFEQEDRSPFE